MIRDLEKDPLAHGQQGQRRQRHDGNGRAHADCRSECSDQESPRPSSPIGVASRCTTAWPPVITCHSRTGTSWAWSTRPGWAVGDGGLCRRSPRPARRWGQLGGRPPWSAARPRRRRSRCTYRPGWTDRRWSGRSWCGRGDRCGRAIVMGRSVRVCPRRRPQLIHDRAGPSRRRWRCWCWWRCPPALPPQEEGEDGEQEPRHVVQREEGHGRPGCDGQRWPRGGPRAGPRGAEAGGGGAGLGRLGRSSKRPFRSPRVVADMAVSRRLLNSTSSSRPSA